jgi:hypothetical protein
VNATSRQYIRITKNNLLPHYHTARVKAFTEGTIKSSFQKTGIHPFNPKVIEDDAFAPALNTTQAAQPVPTSLPPLLWEATISDLGLASSEGSVFLALGGQSSSASFMTASCITAESAWESIQTNTLDLPFDQPPPTRLTYKLVGFPPPLPPKSSRKAIEERMAQLEKFAHAAKEQIEADHASKKLMDDENERLRQQVHTKKNKPAKKRVGGSGARHMTDAENLHELALNDWKAKVAEVHKEAASVFSDIKAHLKAVEDAAKKAELEVERERRKAEAEVEKERKKAAADKEKALRKAESDVAKALEREQRAAAAEIEKA